MNTHLSTAQAARLMGVSDQSVANWIDQGKLRAAHTPGGHRRVERHDLIEFVERQNFRVPPDLMADAASVVLVVDGDPADGARLSQVICSRRPDCRVLAATDGYSAGEIVATENPDVVILDLGMPGLDGVAVCKKIKSRPATRKTVVLVIATDLSPEAERALRGAGAAACLAKPVALNQLQQALRRFLPENPALTGPTTPPSLHARALTAQLRATGITKPAESSGISKEAPSSGR